jgi:hypothetical protein
MKNLSFIAIVIIMFFTACSTKSYKVDGAGNADANMEDFNTYAFASQVDSKLDAGFFFLNDLVLKADIRDAVKHEMDSRGYRHDPSSADLVVNFRVFDKAATIQGLEGLGSNYWSSGEADRFAMKETVNLKEGSLLVHLVNRQTGEIVWQGYASGLMDGNGFNKDKNKISEAVSMIFDSYNHRADKL